MGWCTISRSRLPLKMSMLRQCSYISYALKICYEKYQTSLINFGYLSRCVNHVWNGCHFVWTLMCWTSNTRCEIGCLGCNFQFMFFRELYCLDFNSYNSIGSCFTHSTSFLSIYDSVKWCINSLWRNDAIWRHRSRSTLAQVMAWCRQAPSHYLNQCWLISSKVQWHSVEGNLTRDSSPINH